MPPKTIAILMPGDMGHAVGRALRENGHDVVTSLTGRSAHTRNLSGEAGLRDIESLSDLISQSDLVLSILPPASAIPQAEAVAEAIQKSGNHPVYVDCNAIAPGSVKQVGDIITSAGAPFIDAGIIGLAPGKGPAPRFYVSGQHLEPMLELDGQGIAVRSVGTDIGQASSLKMVYAALTKGTWTLHTAVLMTASQTGVLPELLGEFGFSQKAALASMQSTLPRLPADSARWVGEMEEIARTFADAGVPSGFHDGAAEIFRILARTPFASETRQTMDTSRTLEESLAVYVEHLTPPSDQA